MSLTMAEAAPAVEATTRRPRPVALLFPGQGSQHAAMAAGLYGHEPVFTEAVDEALELMGEDGPALRADWLADPRRGDRPVIGIDDVRRGQPLLFTVDYALGRMVLGWGVRPAALLGHSAGELAAAVLAGVLELSDAVTMMRERVRHAQKAPAGGMLAVAASEHQVRRHLTDEVVIAAVNSGRQVMLAGPQGPLAEVAAALRAIGLTVVSVPASTPFHSPALAPAAAACERVYRGLSYRAPRLTLYSGYGGDLMTLQQAVDPAYWASHLTDPVYFAAALDQLLAVDDMLLLEAGPRQTLTMFARRHQAVQLGASVAVPLLPARPGSPEDDRRSVRTAVDFLLAEGVDLDPAALPAP